MQGSQFHIPVIACDLLEVVPEFQKNQVPVYGTELNVDAVQFNQVEKTTNVALVLGNEGQGVASELLQMTDKNLYIPIHGKAESLNVGVAAGILMYAFV
jgi:TrmH family RNA methyltransferase